MKRNAASLAVAVLVFVAALCAACSGGGGSGLPLPSPQPSPQGLYVGNCPSGGQLPTIAYFMPPAGLSQTPGFVSAPIPGGTCVGGLAVQNGFTLIAAAGTAGVGL